MRGLFSVVAIYPPRLSLQHKLEPSGIWAENKNPKAALFSRARLLWYRRAMTHATHLAGRYVFHFASFGAAVLSTFFFVLFLALFLSVVNVQFSLSSGSWVFLFLFPGALALSVRFLSSRTGTAESANVLYGFIAGYAGYILLSLVIILLGYQADPLGWAFPMLVLVAILVFRSGAIFRRLGFESIAAPTPSLPLVFPVSQPATEMPNKKKKPEQSLGAKGDGKPAEEKAEEKEASAQETLAKEAAAFSPDESVIHLGPRKDRGKT